MVAPMSVFMSLKLFCVVVLKESPLCPQPDWQEVKAHHLGTVQGGAVGGHTLLAAPLPARSESRDPLLKRSSFLSLNQNERPNQLRFNRVQRSQLCLPYYQPKGSLQKYIRLPETSLQERICSGLAEFENWRG